jgi:uncharacterized protein
MEQPMVSGEERNWAMWAHLCGLAWLFTGSVPIFLPMGVFTLATILGPLIIWRAKLETMPFAAAQAKESLNFQITVFLLAVIFGVLTLILIGFLFLWILGILNLVMVLIAAIQVHGGKAYRYPFCLRLVA